MAMYNKPKTILGGISLLFINVGLFAVYSAGAATVNSINFDNPTATNTTQELVTSVVNWLLGITSAVVVLFLVYGGIMYITASGDENQVEKAKKIITYAIIGLFLVLVSYSVVTTLNNIIFGP